MNIKNQFNNINYTLYHNHTHTHTHTQFLKDHVTLKTSNHIYKCAIFQKKRKQ